MNIFMLTSIGVAVDSAYMALTINVDPDVHARFKGELAIRGLSLSEGVQGMALFFLSNPDKHAELIRAHLAGRDASGNRASQPTQQPGGSRSARKRASRKVAAHAQK